MVCHTSSVTSCHREAASCPLGRVSCVANITWRNLLQLRRIFRKLFRAKERCPPWPLPSTQAAFQPIRYQMKKRFPVSLYWASHRNDRRRDEIRKWQRFVQDRPVAKPTCWGQGGLSSPTRCLLLPGMWGRWRHGCRHGLFRHIVSIGSLSPNVRRSYCRNLVTRCCLSFVLLDVILKS